MPVLREWHSRNILKKFNYVTWNESIRKIHSDNFDKLKNSFYLKRLIFDEIMSNFLMSSQIRQKIKKIKKKEKKYNKNIEHKYLKKLNFKLTKDQIRAIEEINIDLKSKDRMFRLIQGDVGSGKTIVSLISALNVMSSGYQVVIMVPTEILAKQHYKFASKFFGNDFKIELLTGKIEYSNKKKIVDNIRLNKLDLIIGTHALFQKKIYYNNLGLIIIDEQHKFGVRQRKELSEKGGNNCDVLVMSATPIPRNMMLTIYGDMDVNFI